MTLNPTIGVIVGSNRPGRLGEQDVRAQVSFTLATDFEHYSVFTPGDHHLPVLTQLLDQLTAWSAALAPLRTSGVAA